MESGIIEVAINQNKKIMPLDQNPLQAPTTPNSDRQQESPAPKRNAPLRIVGLLGAITGMIFLIPGVLFIFGMIFTVLTSGAPQIDIAAETKNIQSYLHERYGKDFEVGEIKGHGASSLGDKPSLTAKAHPEDDKELEVSVYKKFELGGRYSDTYLQAYWSKKNKDVIAPKLREIFGIIPTFTNAITPSFSLNQSDMRGRVISLEEVFSKYRNQVSYQATIDLGVVGSTTTQENISAQLYQLILYMRQQINGSGSSVELNYDTKDATYACSLHGFNYDFIENAEQLHGCWTKKMKETAQNPKRKYESMTVLKDSSLPVTFKGYGIRLVKVPSIQGASVTYSINEASRSLATISVYPVGYGKKINQEKKDFPANWLKNNIAVPVGARSALLTPDASVMMGALVYRADSTPGTRTVHYAIAYKKYLIYVQAKTLNGGTDTRDREFYLKRLIDTIEPLDGFSSI